MERSKQWKAALATVGLAALMACGGEDAQPIKQIRNGSNAASQPATPSTAPGGTGDNRAPNVESVQLTPAHPSATDRLRAQVKIVDPDGDHTSVKYTWWANGRRVGEGSSFELSSVGRGSNVEVSVVASDGQLESSPVTASVTLGNSPPQISSIRFEPSGAWFANRSIAAVPEAADPDGDPLTFEYTWYHNDDSLLEAGPTLDGAKLKRGDVVQLVVVASDGYAKSNELRTEPIRVSNTAPEVVSQPSAIGADGVFRYAVRASDPDGDRSFQYHLIEAPPGAEIDRLGGNVVWRPSEAHVGTQKFVIEVDDRMGGKITQEFTLDVTFDSGRSSPASPR